MSTWVELPPVYDPPLEGQVVKVHRMPGHYVGDGDPLIDVKVDRLYIVTVNAPRPGKIVRCRKLGEWVKAGDWVCEVTQVGEPTWELFIAHRWKDSPGHAGRIADALLAHFGPGQVFRDIESVPIGDDFRKEVREKLQLAFVMVVVVGPNWLKELNHRLTDPNDLHREEIRTALTRGTRIVPAIVGGASMPTPEELPDDMKGFSNANGIRLHDDAYWPAGIGLLRERLTEILAASPDRLAFLAQVPPWSGGTQWQFIINKPKPIKAQE